MNEAMGVGKSPEERMERWKRLGTLENVTGCGGMEVRTGPGDQ